MNAINTFDINKEIVRLFISYGILKLLAFAVWNCNGEEINKEEFKELLYSYSRVMEHNEKFVESIYENLRRNGYDSMSYLVLLIR